MRSTRGAGAPVPAAVIDAARRTIDRGEVVAYPTETFYALGADPRQPRALAAVLDLKGRDAEGKPLLLLVSRLAMVDDWMGTRPPAFDLLAGRFWPGPLTLVVPALPGLPEPVTAGGRTVALRLTSHPVAQALIEACGVALTGTSANPSGAPPAVTPAMLIAAFGADAPYVLDGGETPGGPPSTLLDLSNGPPRVLRAGAVGEDEIKEALRPAAG